MEHRFIGEDLDITITLDPIDGFSFTANDFEVELWVGSEVKVAKLKTQCEVLSATECAVRATTEELGAGLVKAVVRAYIPNKSFKNNVRRAVGYDNVCIIHDKFSDE
jgi:hypothetical protein